MCYADVTEVTAWKWHSSASSKPVHLDTEAGIKEGLTKKKKKKEK